MNHIVHVCCNTVITVQHVSAYTVVRAIPPVDGRERFSATWGSETPEPIKLKFGKIDYAQHTTPHAKTDTRCFRGIGWGWGEVATSCAFFITGNSDCFLGC